MKLYIYIHPYLPNMYVYYSYTIPNIREIWHIWSCIGRQKSAILTPSSYFKVLPYNSPWTEVDDHLPQHTSTLARHIFIKRIRIYSTDVEIYKTYTTDPLIKPTFYKDVYKGNFLYVYLQIYRRDLKSVWRLFISMSNSSIYITCKWIESVVEKLIYICEI